MLETAAFRRWRGNWAIERFHGIDRLGTARGYLKVGPTVADPAVNPTSFFGAVVQQSLTAGSQNQRRMNAESSAANSSDMLIVSRPTKYAPALPASPAHEDFPRAYFPTTTLTPNASRAD